MRTAAITFYTFEDKYKLLKLQNGYSFISHRLENCDHIFVTIKDDIESVIANYDLIYVTLTHSDQLEVIKKIVDKRFVIGGPLCRSYTLEDYLKPATVSRLYFEEFLGVPFDDKFTPYWEPWLKTLNFEVPHIEYLSLLSRRCYWGKCTFCYWGKGINKYDYRVRGIERDFKKVSQTLPTDNRNYWVWLIAGGCHPKKYKEIIEYTRMFPKNIKFSMFIRFDDLIYDIVKKASDLTGLHHAVGLETFTQNGNDLLKKGKDIKTTFSCIKEVTEKGGVVSCSIVSLLPFMNEEIYEESIKNIDWLVQNIKHRDKFVFHIGYEYMWPTEEIASLYGDYNVIPYENNHIYDHNIASISKITSVMSDKTIDLCNKIIDYVKKNFTYQMKYQYTRKTIHE